MHTIVQKEIVTERTWHMRLEAPLVAGKCQAGQFLMLRIHEQGERIPLTIADWDRAAGTIDIYFQEIGATTELLATMAVGDRDPRRGGTAGQPDPRGETGRDLCHGGWRASASRPVIR